MNLPVKYGNVYIKFDDEGKPEYGFEVDPRETLINKFLVMSDKKIDTIVLPKLVQNFQLSHEQLKNPEMLCKNKKTETYLSDYLTGNIRLCPESFIGVDNVKIVVPTDCSIMICDDAFAQFANIEFVTNNNLSLKIVKRKCFDSSDSWRLIADKNLNTNVKVFDTDYQIKDHLSSNFKVRHEKSSQTELSL